MTLEPPGCGDEAIWRAWMSAMHAPTLAVADELGLFSALADTPATAGELAARIGIEDRAGEALAGLFVALGFLASTGGRFALTDVARTYLLPSSPYYWGGLLQRIRDSPIDCRTMIDALRRGRVTAETRITEMWRSPQPPDEALIAFTHTMHAHSFGLAMRTIGGFGLDGARRLLDVAGGSGSYSIAAAVRHPALRCTVLDLPAVCRVATSYATQHGVADRVAAAPGDMFADPWPSDHDCVLFSDIFHDWDDARCRLLADRAYAALPPGGRILVHEMLLDADRLGPLDALAYSTIMLFVTEGRQRSAAETCAILTAAGFREIEVASTANGYSLVTGVV